MPPPLRRHSSSYQEVGSGGLCNLLLTSRTREGPGSGTLGVWNLPPLEPRGHCCKGAQATVLGREKAHGQPSSGLTEALHRTESSWTRQLEVPASGLRCRTARDNPAEEPPPRPRQHSPPAALLLPLASLADTTLSQHTNRAGSQTHASPDLSSGVSLGFASHWAPLWHL